MRALLYRLDATTPAGEVAQGLLQAMGIPRTLVDEEDLATPVWQMLDLPEPSDPTAPPVPHEAISPEAMAEILETTAVVFSNISIKEVQKFLQAYAASGADRISVKSMVTQHNQAWRLDELLVELHMEDRFVRMYQHLARSLGPAQALLDDPDFPAEAKPALAEARSQAEALLQAVQDRQEVTAEELEVALKRLAGAANQGSASRRD